MKVVMVATECTPFFKTGGLADVIGSLPHALSALAHELIVFLPKSTSIPTPILLQLEWVDTFFVPVTWRNQHCAILSYKEKNVTYYFIENDYYFDRKPFYGQEDDGERFTFFTHAVLESMEKLALHPDVLHCHDWQTGLLPAYIKAGAYSHKVKTVFTIHNLRYQGVFPHSIFNELLHLDKQHQIGLDHNGAINFMKAAIVHADWITTVSPTYAKEIQSSAFGEGLDSLIRERNHSLTGIINGIDEGYFNPATDFHIPVTYHHQPERKRENKKALQDKLGLTISEHTPLISLISRLVEEKGVSLVTNTIDDLLQAEDVQFVCLGSGDPVIEEQFEQLAQRYPDRVAFYRGFNEELASFIYAASDFLVMPSKFEPCGLSQLIALRYETVPIVRETGGLKDTILSFNEFTGEGNGLSFTNYKEEDFLYTVRRGLWLYREEALWKQLQHNIYTSKFDWSQSAKAYEDVYKHVVNEGAWDETDE
ncbi:glycogen/starch synthase [Alkalihalophilus lindianensis]|uniref:Glycogen synthase n=1 Tax=Alkalihalophilus lindianensis TaxID=1630542 RepID=A0ABU3XEG3_9BACI|nr:glycogen/starch synthase [Alkalihalophilus lindianensis]MDV2686218.1 glycogen/starch synthase [Alkalihalophilus lindianensis]